MAIMTAILNTSDLTKFCISQQIFIKQSHKTAQPSMFLIDLYKNSAGGSVRVPVMEETYDKVD